MKNKGFWSIIFLSVFVLLFFFPAIVSGKVFLPADTIVGLYHPYRDLYAKEYPNGIPYKNFLITDPVRQQYPWKYLVSSSEKKGQLPTWNPYNFAGTPLLGNFQSGGFYPFNILFLALPFLFSWNVYILLQPVLGSIFMYLYLRNLKFSTLGSLLGGFVFVFSGFTVAWLEWGNIGHTSLWLPLILLSIDTFFHTKREKTKLRLPIGPLQAIPAFSMWLCVCMLALVVSFFAGHLQTFFYLFLIVLFYFLFRWLQNGRDKFILSWFIASLLLFSLLTFPQWGATAQFITESARAIDQMDWHKDGWFIPWQHSIQFFAPDFFGNPTTLNYFGVWNYAEFIGYIGIFPLVLSLLAVMFRRDRVVVFYTIVLGVALICAFPTPLARLPFLVSVPFVSTAQPTRLLFVIDLALAVLTACGFDYFVKEKKKIIVPLILLSVICMGIWVIVLFTPQLLTSHPQESIAIAKRNLQLPTFLLLIVFFISSILVVFKTRRLHTVLLYGLLILTAVDLFRFTGKFLPMTNREYVYPETRSIHFLKEHLGNNRLMALDSRILPPNFSIMYGLQSVEGYDPLYIQSYGELIASSERKKPDKKPPFGFNRIITPHTSDSPIMNLLGVKYVLSLSDISSPTLKKVFEEGQTQIYENTASLPRAFFVREVTNTNNRQQALSFLFTEGNNLRTKAVVDAVKSSQQSYASGSAEIVSYNPEQVRIRVKTTGEGMLVLTDSFYPTWKAKLFNRAGSLMQTLPVMRADYHFRSVIVPKGEYIVEFSNTLL